MMSEIPEKTANIKIKLIGESVDNLQHMRQVRARPTSTLRELGMALSLGRSLRSGRIPSRQIRSPARPIVRRLPPSTREVSQVRRLHHENRPGHRFHPVTDLFEFGETGKSPRFGQAMISKSYFKSLDQEQRRRHLGSVRESISGGGFQNRNVDFFMEEIERELSSSTFKSKIPQQLSRTNVSSLRLPEPRQPIYSDIFRPPTSSTLTTATVNYKPKNFDIQLNERTR